MKKACGILILLTFIFSLSFSVSASGTDSPAAREPAVLIDSMISAYSASRSLSDPALALLTDELRARDTVLAGLWTDIIAYWDELNRSGIHPVRLPDGLPRDSSLCVIVLGYALKPDGEMRPELIGRLETALECARQYPDAYILCTGGPTASGCPEATEAERMGDWLVQNGLERDRLFIENRSLTTVQNAQYSAEILYSELPQVRSVAIVSSDYHIPWAQVLFEAVFLKNAALHDKPALHAVSNAAYLIGNSAYSDAVQSQASVLRRLIDR